MLLRLFEYCCHKGKRRQTITSLNLRSVLPQALVLFAHSILANNKYMYKEQIHWPIMNIKVKMINFCFS